VPLTLRSVCGLPTAEIAAAFLVPEPTMASGWSARKRKIRQAASRWPSRRPASGPGGSAACCAGLPGLHRRPQALGRDTLVRGDLCDQAISLARSLAALVPDEAEVRGLLGVAAPDDAPRAPGSARRATWCCLADQDRSRWDRAQIAEGEALLAQALRGPPARALPVGRRDRRVHSCVPRSADTDWKEIAALYKRAAPLPADAGGPPRTGPPGGHGRGPAAGSALLDEAAADRRCPLAQLHIARR